MGWKTTGETMKEFLGRDTRIPKVSLELDWDQERQTWVSEGDKWASPGREGLPSGLGWRNCPVVVNSLWLLGSCQNLQFHCGPKRGLGPGFAALLSVSFAWNCSCFTLSSSASASLTLWVGWFSVVGLCCAVWNIVCGLYSLAGQSTTQLRQLRFLDIARCFLGMCACTLHKV